MIVRLGTDAVQMRIATTMRDLESCNRTLDRHGMALSAEDVRDLAVGRLDSLDASGRVEFGAGVTRDIVLAFCESPYVEQATFVQTVLDLQDLFYEVKNESLEQFSDDEIIENMRALFDDVAHGDIEYLAEALLEGLSRHARVEACGADVVPPHLQRLRVSDWTDDTYAPPWAGASWLDE